MSKVVSKVFGFVKKVFGGVAKVVNKVVPKVVKEVVLPVASIFVPALQPVNLAVQAASAIAQGEVPTPEAATAAEAVPVTITEAAQVIQEKTFGQVITSGLEKIKDLVTDPVTGTIMQTLQIAGVQIPQQLIEIYDALRGQPTVPGATIPPQLEIPAPAIPGMPSMPAISLPSAIAAPGQSPIDFVNLATAQEPVVQQYLKTPGWAPYAGQASLWSAIKNSLIWITNWIWQFLTQTWNNLITGIFNIGVLVRETSQVIASIGSTISNWVWEGLKWLGEVIWKAISPLISTIWDSLKWIGEILWNLIKPIVEPIVGAFSWLGERIGTVFEVVGEWTLKGLQWIADKIGYAVEYWAGVFTRFWSEHLLPFFKDLLEKLKTSWDFLSTSFNLSMGNWWNYGMLSSGEVADQIFPMVWEPLHPAFERVKDRVTDWAKEKYDIIQDEIDKVRPITPDNVIPLAGKLFLTAAGMGVAAHLLANLPEWLYFSKHLGLGYISAFLVDLGQFSRIAAATMGVLVAMTIRQPFTYAINERFRPLQPEPRDLMMMAVKPDIDIPIFRKGMSYYGYSEEWIDKFQRTMYHEPRYFELKMMSEDEAATDEWLFEKSRRAGFNPDDSKIMVSSYVKSAVRTQRMDFFKLSFNLYKEGFISEAKFNTNLDSLEMRKEGVVLAKKAADMAYTFDSTLDMIKLYTDEFKKEVITEEEFSLSLSALGLKPEKIELIVNREKIRKLPKPARGVPREVATQMRKIQSEYIRLYTHQYRKDLVDKDTFLLNLIELGVNPELAEVTVTLEATKKLS